MSQVCIKCAKGVDHDPEICPKNYEGSSKGIIEPPGSIRLTTKRFDTGKVVIGKHVGDYNSSCRMVMRHSFQDLINTGKMRSDEWPQFKRKKKKPNNGLLPALHPPIVFRADKGHRVRNYAKFFFCLAGKVKAEKFGCTGIYAERMKQQMSWTLRLYASGSFEDFQTAVTAVLEHHFNNHNLCGTWCKAKYGSDAEKK
jgi:hypothetical protein